jgi:hypothetical protein
VCTLGPEDHVELSLAGAGDIDGDGADDILIGSLAPGAAPDSGVTWLPLSPW